MADLDLGTASFGLRVSPGAFGMQVPLEFSGTSLANIGNGGVFGVQIEADNDNVASIGIGLTEPEIRGSGALSARSSVTFGLTGTLSVELPPVVPPVGLSPLYIRRRSPIMPTVTGRNARGEPLT